MVQSAVEYAATTARPRLQVAIRGKAEEELHAQPAR
jgi:hypothetical protein